MFQERLPEYRRISGTLTPVEVHVIPSPIYATCVRSITNIELVVVAFDERLLAEKRRINEFYFSSNILRRRMKFHKFKIDGSSSEMKENFANDRFDPISTFTGSSLAFLFVPGRGQCAYQADWRFLERDRSVHQWLGNLARGKKVVCRCLCGYRFSETIGQNSEIVFHKGCMVSDGTMLIFQVTLCRVDFFFFFFSHT